MPQKARNPVKATRTSFEILETLASDGGIGVTEIADRLGVSKGTVSNHLSTLHELGYVTNENSRYYLGCGFLRLGTIARDRRPISAIADAHAERLAEVTGERSAVAVEENGFATYLHTAPGDHDDTEDVRPGRRVPLHCTAQGKAILSSYSDDRVRSVLDGYDRVEWTETTITDPFELRKELEVVREQGIAITRGEYRADRNGLAAPVVVNGDVHGAIGITGPKSRVSGKTLQQDAAGLVVSVAKDVETDLKRSGTI